jgi:transposase
MARRDFTMADLIELYQHWDAGANTAQLAQRVGVDRKTARKYIAEATGRGLAPGQGLDRAGWERLVGEWFPDRADRRLRQATWPQFHEHEAYIREQIAAGVPVKVVHQRLRDEKGVTASYRSLHRWAAANVPPDADGKATAWMPPNPPGQVAQVDYGLLGRWEDPATSTTHRVWGWMMTLRYSRMMFVYPTLKMDQAAWSQAHIAAFEFYGGVPHRTVLDNLKAGVVKADLYDPLLNRAYRELAGGIVKFCGWVCRGRSRWDGCGRGLSGLIWWPDRRL